MALERQEPRIGVGGAMPLLPSCDRVKHETVLWSNILVNSPTVYSVMERRLLYFIALQIKHRFVDRNLGVPESWKELYFRLTDDDLAQLGGKTHTIQTYEALSSIGEKFISLPLQDKTGKTVLGKIHWIDAFFYQVESGQYLVRVSPEMMPFLINLGENFTTFDVATAIQLTSKYTQKFYEICCQFAKPHHFKFHGRYLKPNVIALSIKKIKYLFDLNDQIDPRTGKVIKKSSCSDFTDIRRRILDSSAEDLRDLYYASQSNVWFDYSLEKKGRKVELIYLYIYTHQHPKSFDGDQLDPFEEDTPSDEKPQISVNVEQLAECSLEDLERLLEQKLKCYLTKKDTWYYLGLMHQGRYHTKDSYLQVLREILIKEGQEAFSTGTVAYQRKAIKLWVLKENLKKHGWSLEPPKRVSKTGAQPMIKQLTLFT